MDTPEFLVAEALAEWIGADLLQHNDFAREGLPNCDAAHLLRQLQANNRIAAAGFSIAIVGFSGDFAEVETLASQLSVHAITDDLHVATEWRNHRDAHPRIVALARGYNPSVHGLDFFARTSSSELAAHLLRWGARQARYTATPMHVRLLAELTEARSLQGLRSLENVAAFLAAWNASPDPVDAPRSALPELGVLPDPGLFEAPDLGKRLARNLAIRTMVTVLAPGEIRQRRERAALYKSPERRAEMEAALDRLETFRQGETDHGLTLEHAEWVVKPPRELPEPTEVLTEPEADEEAVVDDVRGVDQGLHEQEVDALLTGRDEDLDAIGEAIDRAWSEFDEGDDRISGTAETTSGPVNFDVAVNVKALDWARAFCSGDRFGGLIETEVLDFKQALERYPECDPVFLELEDIWRHDGRNFSFEQLLAGWDSAVGEEAGRPLAIIWREFIGRRVALAEYTRQLLVHPREFLDTHSEARATCAAYLALASELYAAVQSRFPVVSDESPEWAQATLDALLSMDLLQVRIRQGSDFVSSKAVMLPLHPLHLWRYFRIGEMLRAFARDHELAPADRAALLFELQRVEQFLSVVRAGRAPANRGLDQVLPVANHIEDLGLATFENLRNAISNADGVETLARAVSHFALLYPNHTRPLRLALVNPPEPTRIVERMVRLLDEHPGNDGIGRIEIDVFCTDGHRDRLAAAALLEGDAQDLIYEKVASERLELRVAPAPGGSLAELIATGFGRQRFHLLGLFDESSIAIRKQRIDTVLRMSPFCVRNEITVDGILGGISLRPHPGEPPFSDFVLMIQARQGERLDSAMYAAADADDLRALTDLLVTGDDPVARWIMLADRALPREAGMKSVRLLERPEGKRQILLAAGDYDRLADAMEIAFQRCNLPVGRRELAAVLRQGAHLVGGGLLDLIRKQSGDADSANVVGFVGMLLAARDIRRRDQDSLVASVDSRVARLWLRLGIERSLNRCDLLALKRTPEGVFVFTTLEVKTTLDAALSDEEPRVEAAVRQVASTAQVIRSAMRLEEGDVFSAPRLEMLKEVLVRAAGVQWQTEEADAEHRRRWGPWLKELFDGETAPLVRVESEVVLVKLRANREPARKHLHVDGVDATLSTITEPLARQLLGIDEEPGALPAPDRDPPPGRGDGGRGAPGEEGQPRSTASRQGVGATPVAQGNTHPLDPLATGRDAGRRGDPSGPEIDVEPAVELPKAAAPIPSVPHAEPAVPEQSKGDWPPQVNALGMIGQNEVARELADLAAKSKGWNERFPDKLLVGPAGVGKTSLAYEVSTQFLGLTPVLFNGADLRRPEMIVERLIKTGSIAADAPGNADTVVVEPCVVFVDEVHAIAPSVATALLSALDERRTTTVDNTVYSFEKVVFLLATTDPGKLSEAFLSRPTRTSLRPYSLEEIAGIVWLRARGMLDEASLSHDTCLEIAARMQASPRPSVQILQTLIASFYAKAHAEGDGATPTRRDVAARMNAADVGQWFSETLQVDANGLRPIHRDLLALLAQRGAVSEEEIKRSLSISNRGDFVEIVAYLSRLGMIKVGSGGRSLTREGRRYVVEGDKIDLRDLIAMRNG